MGRQRVHSQNLFPRGKQLLVWTSRLRHFGLFLLLLHFVNSWIQQLASDFQSFDYVGNEVLIQDLVGFQGRFVRNTF
jgi:hypothetical protein